MREKLIELVKQGYNKYFNPNWALDLFALIADHLIANDVVPVVRCKDCKYGEYDYTEYFDYYECRYIGGDWNKGDHFCSHGERKDNG